MKKFVYGVSAIMSCVLITACSDVRLNYGLGGAAGQIAQIQPPLSQERSTFNLADLNIQARVQSQAADLAGLQVRLRLVHKTDSTMDRVLTVSADEFIENPNLFWDSLVPGDAELQVELVDADNRVLSRVQNQILLTENAQQRFDFFLLPPADSGAAPQLTLSPAPDNTTDTSLPALSDTSPDTSTPNPVIGTGDSTTTPVELPFRILEQTSSSITAVWETPANQDVQGYRILVNGKVVAENHPVANFRFSNLFADSNYTLEVQPILKDGSLLNTVPVETRTTGGASGGGGGGGGGGGSSSGSSSGGGNTGSGNTSNSPPVIQSLTPHVTTVNGLGYPVKLTAVATDDQPLSNGAYSWSCDNCGDASFTRTDSPEVIWNAPTTPGTYTIRLTVSDGVNPPVSREQTLTVNHQQATVTVVGDYQ